MIWYISATIFYVGLELPLYTNYQGGLFQSEARCVRYLSEHRDHLKKSFENSFKDYEYKGTTYTIEAFRLECKSMSKGTAV